MRGPSRPGTPVRRRERRTHPGRRALLGALLAAVAATTASACWIEEVAPEAGDGDEDAGLREEVREMLDASAAAWNRGDLEAFLSDYERSPNTTYIGSSGLIRGWDGIRARYAPTFAPGAERDSLRFIDLRVRPLNQRYALATARYLLHRGGEVTSSGPFTLVLQSVESQWKIIHDHSSADTLGPASVDAAAEGPPARSTGDDPTGGATDDGAGGGAVGGAAGEG